MLEVTEELYEAVLNRDHLFDGKYYIGIVSTGIVCFPSCRSRTPKKENIRVFETLEEALREGFRPCKRCRPEAANHLPPDAEIGRQVLDILRTRYQEPITLRTLSEALNLSPYHLQRVFKRVHGISPAKQLQRIRMDAARRFLEAPDKPIADVALDVGFRSISHFSSTFQKEIGMSPMEYRSMVIKVE